MDYDRAEPREWRIIHSHKQSNKLNKLNVCSENNLINNRRFIMWTTPAATEMRFGFEVTMYVMNK